jgi:uncharacterized protein YkwD
VTFEFSDAKVVLMHRKTQIFVVFAAVFCALLVTSSSLAARLSPAETGLLRAVNATRAAHGLGTLQVDSTLTLAARSHSRDMLRGNYFAHGAFTARMLGFHVQGAFAGENLAWGNGAYASAGTIVSEWLASPEHRANLLRPGFTRIGIGATQGTFLGRSGATVLTADFAGR